MFGNIEEFTSQDQLINTICDLASPRSTAFGPFRAMIDNNKIVTLYYVHSQLLRQNQSFYAENTEYLCDYIHFNRSAKTDVSYQVAD